ncbi:sigma-70, region 4 [Leptospira broomii serovar Hurstbridge str. 5399]|uniref:Sigma-70, region 4 n=1 Tax=Leptospira broomii serovar Hurstbridge str. 5399 TaxID=1049789 RepID=T0F8A2_9LEPT|nr:RNA polymerase sigma factor [Leptospira broomii]EQA44126.1 sigma-70, region 4 [Leptospira broomii serovar Hurstbridge str. 5399]
MAEKVKDDFRKIIDGCILLNQSSWREFIHRYDRVLTGTIVNFQGKDEADDVFQKVLLKLVEKDFFLLRNFRGSTEAEFRSYIIQITKNLLRNENRSFFRRRESFLLENEELDLALIKKSEEAWKKAEENLIYREMFEKFEGLLQNLDLKSREIIYFRLRGLKFREISKILGIKINTVLSLNKRALEKIKASREFPNFLQ